MNCSVSTNVVTRGVDNPVITITATASDPDNDVLTYAWDATGGATVSGSGAQITVNTGSLPAGTYTVNVTVNDGHDHARSCASTFTIKERPAPPCPTMGSVTADPMSVEAGTNTRITLHAQVAGGDGSSLTYQWSADRGTISGSGDTVSLDTAGLGAGSVNISVTATDSRCNVNGSVSVSITSPAAPPMAQMLSSCITYKQRNVTRADNVCKAILQDVAAKLQQDPRATVVIQGYADANEKVSAAQARAEAARDFLVTTMHIDANRIKIVALGSKASPNASANNRIITIWLVPEGAREPQ